MAQLLPENSTLERTVRRAAEQGRLSHAIVLSGTGDLTDAARFIAAAHVCEGTDRPCLRCRHCRKVLEGIHPDVSVIRDTEHRELTVDAVRELRQDVYIRPNEAARKVYIIADSRQLNERDQNVLLKIVEEGPPYAAFIFCTDSPTALLETVRPRCVLLKYDAVSEDALPPESAAMLSVTGPERLGMFLRAQPEQTEVLSLEEEYDTEIRVGGRIRRLTGNLDRVDWREQEDPEGAISKGRSSSTTRRAASRRCARTSGPTTPFGMRWIRKKPPKPLPSQTPNMIFCQ